jgi:Spy/CpxP family protein refolding chaperone
MKTLSGIVLLSLMLAGAGSSAHAQNLPEALAENFYPPELVRMAQPALNLTDEQKASLQEAVERIGTRNAETGKLLEKETGLLLALVKAEPLDGDAVMAQSDKVMRLEQEARRASLALLIRIRETLTPEQQAKLREFKTKTAGFQARVRQALELARKWKQEGRDLSGFEQARGQFEALMSQGDFKAADALLENTLKRLKEPPSEPKK